MRAGRFHRSNRNLHYRRWSKEGEQAETVRKRSIQLSYIPFGMAGLEPATSRSQCEVTVSYTTLNKPMSSGNKQQRAFASDAK